jgi:hypothetical protein
VQSLRTRIVRLYVNYICSLEYFISKDDDDSGNFAPTLL